MVFCVPFFIPHSSFLISHFGGSMKVAIIGSRNALHSDYSIISRYIPSNTSEIVSGGAKGIDLLAKKFALENGLLYKEFLPDYEDKSLDDKRKAPLLRNKQIVEYADYFLAFWDGVSRGTAFTIDYCVRTYKPVKVYILENERKKSE